MYNFFTFLQDGENFLKYDSGPGNDRILIFSTTKNLEVLAEASSWFIDATFKVVPDIFYQMLTVHGKLPTGWTIPLVFALMPNKLHSSYLTVFNELKQLQPNLNPDTVMMDFEQGLQLAITTAFPSYYVRGCLFHWGQAIHRRVVLQGLLSQYKDITSHVRRDIRRILGLPFLPEDIVVAIWENEIKPSLDPSVLPLCSYSEETWLGDNARYNKDVWPQYHSVLTGQDRTNNKLEGFHSGLKKFCGGTKLQFWKFLESLTSLQAMTHMNIIKSNQGDPSPATRKKYRQQNSRLHSIVCNFNVHADVMEYLDSHSLLCIYGL